MWILGRALRIAFASLFILAGVMKLLHFSEAAGYVALLAHLTIPQARVVLVAVSGLEIVVGCGMLVSGSPRVLRIGIAMMVLFTLWSGLYSLYGEAIVCRCFGARIAFLEGRYGYFFRNFLIMLMGISAYLLDRRKVRYDALVTP